MAANSQIITAHKLLAEALDEDRREGGYFDVWGFQAFFPEHDPRTIADAWALYLDHYDIEREQDRENESRIRDAAEGFPEG